MHESVYARVQDGVIWRCPPKTCRAAVSIRKGSFFEGAHLPLQKLLDLAYYWAIYGSHAEVKRQVDLENQSVTDWFSFMRDLCTFDLLSNPVQLGGQGHIVAIDETVVARAKPGNRHAGPVPTQWVFGAVDITTGQFFVHLVPDRSAGTLNAII